MKIILPFRGEFGMKLMRHVPQVNAIKDDKVVCCEIGEEAFYPSASSFEICETNADSDRREAYNKDAAYVSKFTKFLCHKYGKDTKLIKTDKDMPCKYFIPKPMIEYGINPDIVICPRKRGYGTEKNWPLWQDLVDKLDYNLFAAGAPDSSYDVKCDRAWDYNRHLDATIEAINNSKLVVATDAGVAHLAVQCGKPLIIISYKDGLVAPGPVRKADGSIAKKQYWPIMLHRYSKENHTNSEIIVIVDAWSDLNKVVKATVAMIKK